MIERIERSPSGRAKCKRCRKTIEKGEIRVQYMWRLLGGVDSPGYLHLACAVDEDVEAVEKALRTFDEAFDGRAAIEATVEARIKAIAERKKPVSERDPALLAVEPVRDASGRPTVRVFLAGSAFSLGNGPTFDLDRVAKTKVWASPKREYRFVLQYSGDADPTEDPAQPTIGAIFAPYADSKVMPNQKQKIVAWHKQGLPTPVLWLFARGTALVPTDAQVQQWRSLLDSVGYSGDEAHVVYARSVDETALDALVQALDEALSGAVAATEDGRPEDVAMAARIEEHLEHERFDAANDLLANGALALRKASKDGVVPAFEQRMCHLSRVSSEGRAAFGRAAVRALAFDACIQEALWVLEQTPSADATSAIVGAIARFVGDPKRRLSKAFDALATFAHKRVVAGRGAPVLDALAKAPTESRAIALGEALATLKDDEADRAFVAWVESLHDRDHRRQWLDEARAKAARRVRDRAKK